MAAQLSRPWCLHRLAQRGGAAALNQKLPSRDARPQSTVATSTVVTLLKVAALRTARFVRRYPQLVALFGFVSGVGSYLLVERREAAAQLIAVLMLLSWVWLVLENALHAGVLRRFGLDMPRSVMRFATQMVHQEGLFFALPFFFAATTWGDGHALFTTLLAFCALVALIDPLYYDVLAPRRWLFVVFHALTLFAVLLVALPLLVHLDSAQSFALALASALLFSLPSIATLLPHGQWWRRVPLLLLLLAALAAGLWQARSWIPPAALRLVEISVTQSVDRAAREPGPSVTHVDAAALGRNGLYAWTSVRAPRGLREQIHHVWLHDGSEVDRIALDIEGGRTAGYRGWTHKLNFPSPASGEWQVRVVTDVGQLVGSTRFTVSAAGIEAPAAPPASAAIVE